MKRISIALMVTALFLLAVSPTGYAQTIYVPDDFATIQAALDAADDLYTIIVRDGTYTGPGNKDLDFKGKALTLRSENGPENCVLDREGDWGWGFYFHTGETAASVLDGFTITGGWTSGVYCYESSPTITNCIISENESYDDSAGIYLYYASPSITDCTITKNSTNASRPAYGGGISCIGSSSPTITNCEIIGNVLGYSGSSSGGGIYCGYGTSVTITGCTISGNTDVYGDGVEYGGGISCGSNSTVTISDCLISGNAGHYGGGIYCEWQSVVTISDCTISGNTSNFGGGIYSYSSSSAISDCIITGNSAYSYGGGISVMGSATVEGCIITGNTAEDGGGGLYVHDSSSITNCIIAGNSAEYHGGGVYFSGSSATIANSTIADNRAERMGGGIYCIISNPIFTNCILWGDSAPIGPEIALPLYTPYQGGPTPSTVTASYSDIQGGEAAAYLEVGSSIDWGSGNIDADPLFVNPGYWCDYKWFDGDYHITYGSPCKDTATPLGIGPDIDGDGRPSGSGVDMGADEFVFIPNNCPSLAGGTVQPVSGDSRTQFGFAVQYYDEDGNAPTTMNVVIDGISHPMSLTGGSPADGTYFFETRLSAETHDYHFAFYDGNGCVARLPSGGDFAGPQVVGVTRSMPDDYATIQAALDDCFNGDTIIVRDGVYTGEGNKELDFLGKSITLRSENGPENCIIDCEGDGRAFHFRNRETAGSVLDGFTITNGYVSGYWSDTPGGGILCKNRSTPTIKNCLITDNFAEYGGGLAFTDKALPILLACTFSNNAASVFGGAIYGNPHVYDMECTITDCVITGNSARSGGGIYAGGRLAISNCVITANSADSEGGGCYLGSASVTDCEINGNSAGGNGGAIRFRGSSPVISGCSFVGNSAECDGGVICGNSSVPVLTNCILTGNSAGRYGGAIWLYSGKPDPAILTNCLLTENSAGQRGGAYSSEGRSTFTNCTFSRNSADIGGAVCGEDASELTFENCILSGDIAPNGSEIALLEDSSASVSYSAVRGGEDTIYTELGSSLHTGLGNIGVAPLFAVGPLGPYYLSQTASGQGFNSPCLDAGSDTAINLGIDSATTRTDQAGDTGIADMGYHYEIADSTQLTRISLVSPSNESLLHSAPTFVWTSNGGGRNAFSVELTLSPGGPSRSTPLIPGKTSWTMPIATWNKIPSGSFVYWRVRGADLKHRPFGIIYSDEIWWFYKP